jgi:CBS-domain-containing membrane protein
METRVRCVRSDGRIEDLIELFTTSGVHHAPVVARSGRLVGFVTLADLSQARELEPQPTALRVVVSDGGGYALGAGFHLEPEAHTVREIMSSPAISLPATATLTLASALMAFEGIDRLPIVDDAQRVVGLLSSVSVLRWLAKQGGYCIPGYTQRAHGDGRVLGNNDLEPRP